jgi:L-2-hydroxyglutarate oxidase LhgO
MLTSLIKDWMRKKNNEVLIQTKLTNYFAEAIINSAGAYAAELAKQVNVGREYVCMPFLGAYKKSSLLSQNPKRLVYPVPNPVNPFLGVHTTITLNNELKIGPTAFPVIGKEQYKTMDGFSFKDLAEFLSSSKALLRSNSVNLFKYCSRLIFSLFS